MKSNNINRGRRNFLGKAGASLGAAAFASGCGQSQTKRDDLEFRPMPEQAPEGPELTAGLVGCGGRGTGAAINFLKAGPGLKLTAMGDVFQDKLDASKQNINKEGFDVSDATEFVGFDAYQKVIDSGVDIVLLATPPYFRPMMFKAAVDAGKHVFMEKPVAVDPAGVRMVIEAAGQAKTQNLTVVTGTQRHHQKSYVETLKRVVDGAIGDIVGARCYWNGHMLWYRDQAEKEANGWSDMEWMIRDWVNWRWLSGDHICEQHVHNLDVIAWFYGKQPTSAVGMGGRARRITGDQYDYFAVDYAYDNNNMHTLSMCRQVDGCQVNISEFVVGSKGGTNCQDTIFDENGNVKWKFEQKPEEKRNPYDQEHIDMITAIRTGEPLNEAVLTAESTLTAVMGRTAAYTGKEITWQEMMDSDMKLGPDTISWDTPLVEPVVPVPGEAKEA